MLLPEPHRSSLPFVASLALQSSLVLVLAIPWTVHTLKNNIQPPSVLIYQPVKAVEPPKSTPSRDNASDSLPTPSKQVRLFHLSVVNTKNPISIPAAPEIRLDSGMSLGFSDAARGPGLPIHSGLGFSVPANIQPIREMPQAITVGGKIQAAKLIRQVQPQYPTLARQARIQGVVSLEAIIGVDGTIQQLRVINGHPLLTQSAVQAVQQWKYSPTFLNEKAVEVKTTIEVRFTLS